MTIVLVHGVPETAAVWDPLREILGRSDVVAVELPGFGNAAAKGFGATKEDYLGWLVAELERIGGSGPIDLVGHDWGGGFVVRVVSTRPDLVRSWVTDAGAIGDPAFEWHDFAKIWQTPDEGEEFFAQQLATPGGECHPLRGLRGADRPRPDPGRLGRRDHGPCILALYRSAVDVGQEWGPDFCDIPAPADPAVGRPLPGRRGPRPTGPAPDVVSFRHRSLVDAAGSGRAAAVLTEFLGVGPLRPLLIRRLGVPLTLLPPSWPAADRAAHPRPGCSPTPTCRPRCGSTRVTPPRRRTWPRSSIRPTRAAPATTPSSPWAAATRARC